VPWLAAITAVDEIPDRRQHPRRQLLRVHIEELAGNGWSGTCSREGSLAGHPDERQAHVPPQQQRGCGACRRGVRPVCRERARASTAPPSSADVRASCCSSATAGHGSPTWRSRGPTRRWRRSAGSGSGSPDGTRRGDRRGRRPQAVQPEAAATSAWKRRGSSPASGCHCTARRKGARGSSIASRVPSSAQAAGR